MSLFHDTNTWVLLGFLIFVGFIYKRAANIVTTKLDERADNIRKQIEEARTLREEAQAMLAQYQRQQRDAKWRRAK